MNMLNLSKLLTVILTVFLASCGAGVDAPDQPIIVQSGSDSHFETPPSSHDDQDPVSDCPPPVSFTFVKNGRHVIVTFSPPCLKSNHETPQLGDPPEWWGDDHTLYVNDLQSK